MIKKILIAILLCLACHIGNAQSNLKVAGYVYFEPGNDSFKLTRQQKAGFIGKRYYPAEYDIYGLRYFDKVKKVELSVIYYATLNKYRYSVTDSLGLKAMKLLSFNSLPTTSAHFDTSHPKYPYNRTYIVERFSKNEFKIVEVQSYIGSDNILTTKKE